MRLLADRAGGHDVLWARTDCAGWKDVTSSFWIWPNPKRIVLTLDKDFWQIAVQRRTPMERSGVVLFRVHPAIPENLGLLVRQAPSICLRELRYPNRL